MLAKKLELTNWLRRAVSPTVALERVSYLKASKCPDDIRDYRDGRTSKPELFVRQDHCERLEVKLPNDTVARMPPRRDRTSPGVTLCSKQRGGGMDE